MASAFSHAVAALSIGTCFCHPGMPKRLWIAGALCSVLPDIDVVGFHFGIHYADFWGHCGFTHSFLFAAILATFVAILGFWRASPGPRILWIWSYLFLATASHGFLDAMTDGGLGVAFFSPFDNHRYFLPWQPIPVSPIGVGRFFSARGLKVLQSERTPLDLAPLRALGSHSVVVASSPRRSLLIHNGCKHPASSAMEAKRSVY